MSLNLQQEKDHLKKKLAEYANDIQAQRKNIEEDVNEYKTYLKDKLKDSTAYLEKGKLVAIGFGALFVIYKMFSWIWTTPEPINNDDDKVVIIRPKESYLVKKIKEAIASFILSIAKKELKRIIEKLRENRE